MVMTFSVYFWRTSWQFTTEVHNLRLTTARHRRYTGGEVRESFQQKTRMHFIYATYYVVRQKQAGLTRPCFCDLKVGSGEGIALINISCLVAFFEPVHSLL